MDEELVEHTRAYLKLRGWQEHERLGFGIHGTVLSVLDPLTQTSLACKFFEDANAFARELRVYERLTELQVRKISGFSVPQLLHSDSTWHVLELTLVHRPFILDFAAAYLDYPPHFDDEVWAHWRAEKEAQFGAHWPKVEDILAELEELGIYQTDPSPSNIAFAE